MTTGPDFISIINAVVRERHGVDFSETAIPEEIKASLARMSSIPDDPKLIKRAVEQALDGTDDASRQLGEILNLFKRALTRNQENIKDVVNDMGLNFSSQLRKVREIRSNSDDTSYTIPNFVVPDDISFFEFLSKEKIYSKPKLREAANRENALIKGKAYSATEKLSKADEHKNLSLLMIRAGLVVLKESKNPHLSFDLSIEHRLIRWGLDVLGLPVPKKLNDYNDLYSVSKEFSDSYLGFNATGVLHQETEFFPINAFGVIESLSGLLDSKTDESLSDKERNAIAAILFGVSALSVCEEVMLPILYRFPSVAKMFHASDDGTDYFDKIDRILIGPNTLHPIFEVLCTFIVITQDEDYPTENNLRKSVKLYFDNLGRISDLLLKVFPYKKDLFKMQQGTLIDISKECLGFYAKLSQFFDGIGDTYLTETSKASIGRFSTSVARLRSNIDQLLDSPIDIGPDFTDEISRLLLDHNNTDLDNYKNIDRTLDGWTELGKAAIDAGDFDDASEYLSKAKVYKENLAPAIDVHTDVIDSIILLLSEKIESSNKIAPEPPEVQRLNELEKENQSLNDQLAKANEKMLRMSESLSESYQSKESSQSTVASNNSERTSLMTEELSKVLFDRPTQATVSDAIIAATQMYPNVVLSDNLLARAKNCPYRNIPKLFSYLDMICNEYCSLISTGSPDSEAKSVLGSVYSRGESDAVLSNPKLRAMREFKFNGERKLIAKHLTIGTRRDPTMTVQVHFDIVDGKVLLGRIGEHLPVSSS